ncbi:MAG: class I SAM-dependent methyltransferase [Acutalibacteraceae bacterium]
MIIKNKTIDGGKGFDFGKVSSEYAKYRDIYPQEFYNKILDLGLCKDGQKVLDLGTGTGVLPRNLYSHGANWVGIDISAEQIEQAKKLSEGMNIDYYVKATENIDFPTEAFDVITACQCFWYFDHKKVMPNLYRMLKPDGKLLVLYMAWLPYEDKIAGKSEELVLKYRPEWSGAGEKVHQIQIPDCYELKFDMICHEECLLDVHFSRDTWNGRMKACRGVGAALSKEELKQWEAEHLKMLSETAPEEFDIKHYMALVELQARK